MFRLSVAVLCLLGTLSLSRGDDAAGRERTVRVALALAGTATKAEKSVSRSEPVAAKLDWLVEVKAEKVSDPGKTEPVKAPQPQKELWLMSNAYGQVWYEWRDKGPQQMPAGCANGVCSQPAAFFSR